MYKFSNGIVVFDEKTKEEFVKAGYKLVGNNIVKTNKKVEKKENEANNTSSESIEKIDKQSKKSDRED